MVSKEEIVAFRFGGGSRVAVIDVSDKPTIAPAIKKRSVVAKTKPVEVEVETPTPKGRKAKVTAEVNQKTEAEPVVQKRSASSTDITPFLSFIDSL